MPKGSGLAPNMGGRTADGTPTILPGATTTELRWKLMPTATARATAVLQTPSGDCMIATVRSSGGLVSLKFPSHLVLMGVLFEVVPGLGTDD